MPTLAFNEPVRHKRVEGNHLPHNKITNFFNIFCRLARHTWNTNTRPTSLYSLCIYPPRKEVTATYICSEILQRS